jgi:hypothetical protein
MYCDLPVGLNLIKFLCLFSLFILYMICHWLCYVL